MAKHRFCCAIFKGIGKTTEISELYVNGEEYECDYADQLLDKMSEEGFDLIEHAVGNKGTNFCIHYFTFRNNS